jgi:hypothetical protein
MGKIAIVGYKPKAGKAEALKELMKNAFGTPKGRGFGNQQAIHYYGSRGRHYYRSF